MTMEGSLLHWHFHCLFLIDDLLPQADFALSTLRNDLSLALAGVAGLLNLLVHAWSHLVHLDYGRSTCMTRPLPLQPVQVRTPSPPLPLQASQHLVRSWVTLIIPPL